MSARTEINCPGSWSWWSIARKDVTDVINKYILNTCIGVITIATVLKTVRSIVATEMLGAIIPVPCQLPNNSK